jgi:putative sugar O-methyltransferase
MVIERNPMADALVTEAVENLKTAISLPLPPGFITSSWWMGKQQQLLKLVTSFTKVDDCIDYAQNGGLSGFDHRKLNIDINAVDIIIKKFEQIKLAFPNFDLEKSNLRDSIYSIPSSLFPWKGRHISTIFFWHVYQYLAITRNLCANPSRVLEIGGGYGALARLFKLEHPHIHYAITDIPESLFFAEIFLKINFPNCKTRYVLRPNESINDDTCDFLLVPVQLSATLLNKPFDVAINTGSLQEMPDCTVDYWMDFIQTDAIDAFYSLNYFLNPLAMQISNAEVSNFLCPKLDPYWRILRWETNPPVISIDTDKRWLEILCKRDPLKIRNPLEKKVAAKLFYIDSQGYGRGSMQWLMSLWKSAWLDPQIETLWPLFEFTMELRVYESIAYGRMLKKYADRLTQEQRTSLMNYLQSFGAS